MNGSSLARHCEAGEVVSNPAFTAPLVVQLIPRAKRMYLLTFLDVRNTIAQCLRMNNKIIISFLHVRIN